MNKSSDEGLEEYIFLHFLDSPGGRVAWHVWNKMSPEQKYGMGLSRPLVSGSRVLIMPGTSVTVVLKDGRVLTIGAWKNTCFQEFRDRVKLWWIRQRR